ncbi:MAG: hypothetical protein LBH05_07820 [Deferribacteraceae bacterium]|jgi:hypothetical protein|nr:hypothetical protein [Deferribacteraceae bacterium]
MKLLKTGNALKRFEQLVVLKKVTQTVENFEPVNSYINMPIKAVIQPANPERLNIYTVDFKLRYIKIHSISEMAVNDIIVYKNRDYILIELQDYDDYGYYEALGEEIKTAPRTARERSEVMRTAIATQ